MRIYIQNSIFLLAIFLMIVVSSCSSSQSYAERKRNKYSSSSKRVKSTHKDKYYTGKITSPTNAVKLRSEIVATAKKQIGDKYVYGGKFPQGFDCSGFTTYVYKKNGITLAGSSRSQAKLGKKRSKNNVQRGDLLFFGKGKVTHVAIVADVGPQLLKVIHSTSSRGVVMEDISNSKYWQERYLYGRDVVASR